MVDVTSELANVAKNAESSLWSLSKNDLVKGLVTAVLASTLVLIVSALKHGTAINWSQVENAGLAAGCAYLLKQLGTDQNGKLLGKLKLS